MPYPKSPFNEERINEELLRSYTNEVQIEDGKYLDKLLQWLCTTPQVTSFRVNTLTHTAKDVIKMIQDGIDGAMVNRQWDGAPPRIEIHPILKEVILLHNFDEKCLNLVTQLKEVVVDVSCAGAVLRGAHIFAPGVLGMEAGIRREDKISIYADLDGKCKKGLLKKYLSTRKLFIGNGIVKMIRRELFGENLKPSGIAIQVTDTISRCPNIDNRFLQEGAMVLQNLPSIICTLVLNPKPGEMILDMCAAPGNKTTHIAALMKNLGTLVAIDKTNARIKQLKNKCEKFQANVYIFQADSTKLLSTNKKNSNSIKDGPPYQCGTFDRILLDAPCSGLGQRPQLSNNISIQVLNSYVPLQRKLFENAVGLLKVDGLLVYSTCTVTLAENEEMVEWALCTFSCLELIKCQPHFGGTGLDSAGLSELQRTFVQRFGPNPLIDSVGFFIACFIKR